MPSVSEADEVVPSHKVSSCLIRHCLRQCHLPQRGRLCSTPRHPPAPAGALEIIVSETPQPAGFAGFTYSVPLKAKRSAFLHLRERIRGSAGGREAPSFVWPTPCAFSFGPSTARFLFCEKEMGGRLRAPPAAEQASNKEGQQHGDWQVRMHADRADVATGAERLPAVRSRRNPPLPHGKRPSFCNKILKYYFS